MDSQSVFSSNNRTRIRETRTVGSKTPGPTVLVIGGVGSSAWYFPWGPPRIGAMKDSAKIEVLIKVGSNTAFVDTEDTEQVPWNKSNAVYDRSNEGSVLSEGALYSTVGTK